MFKTVKEQAICAKVASDIRRIIYKHYYDRYGRFK